MDPAAGEPPDVDDEAHARAGQQRAEARAVVGPVPDGQQLDPDRGGLVWSGAAQGQLVFPYQ